MRIMGLLILVLLIHKSAAKKERRSDHAMVATDRPYPTEIPYRVLYCVAGTQTAEAIAVSDKTPPKGFWDG